MGRGTAGRDGQYGLCCAVQDCDDAMLYDACDMLHHEVICCNMRFDVRHSAVAWLSHVRGVRLQVHQEVRAAARHVIVVLVSPLRYRRYRHARTKRSTTNGARRRIKPTEHADGSSRRRTPTAASKGDRLDLK